MTTRGRLYDTFCLNLEEQVKRRKESVELRLVTDDSADADELQRLASATGVEGELVAMSRPTASDRFVGDARVRTMRRLLRVIDESGFERSGHQVQFHDAFIRSCSRIMYREEWPVHKTAIMQHNNWKKAPSEILISTPRRFGKTFS